MFLEEKLLKYLYKCNENKDQNSSMTFTELIFSSACFYKKKKVNAKIEYISKIYSKISKMLHPERTKCGTCSSM